MLKHHHTDRIVLIGAGLTGPLLGIFLARRGFKVEIYERRPDMRSTNISAGRSINLALSTRGIHALRQVGVLDQIMRHAIPMKGRMIHPVTGDLTFQPYGRREEEVIYSISRATLNMVLMDAAERHSVKIHFQHKCTGIDPHTGEVFLQREPGGKRMRVRCATTIGTDGSASAIRMQMMKGLVFNYSQTYLDYGYKELTIPAGAEGIFQMEPNALHIWPRKTYMLIALPNPDGSFTCIFFYPFEGPESLAELNTDQKVLDFFSRQFPDAVALMPDLLTNYNDNPVGSMITIKCTPWHVGGKALLLGDAAHAIVPFFGQGMNCAFEDCSVFDECLDRFDGEWETVFRTFESLRKENTDAIADLAVENFVEMRDKVADPAFLLSKRVDLLLEEKFSDRYIPKYAMVTFHRMPYAVALSRGRIQDRILNELCHDIMSEADVDWGLAEELVQRELEPIREPGAMTAVWGKEGVGGRASRSSR